MQTSVAKPIVLRNYNDGGFAVAQKFRPGDLVQLKSGGPVMTLEVPDTDYTGEWKGGYVCSWFAGAKNNKQVFAEAALKPAAVDE